MSLAARPVTDLAAFIEDARSLLRTTAPLARRDWLGVYEQGLRAAYATHDLDGLSQLVGIATARFDSEGSLSEALAEVDYAIGLAHGLPDEMLLLLSERAPLLASTGDLAAARASLSEARTYLGPDSRRLGTIHYRACAMVVAAMGMEDLDTEAAAALVDELAEAGRAATALLLQSWVIPCIVARGYTSLAGPWIRALAVRAEVADHPWRRADADAFSALIERAAGWSGRPDGADHRYVLHADSAYDRNWLARQRIALFDTFVAARRRDEMGARAALTDLRSSRATVHKAYQEADTFAQMHVDATFGLRTTVSGPPSRASLHNLGSILAAAEAVVLAGTQAEAARWRDFFSDELPLGVRTSIDWPVSRDRIQALLEARAGDARLAITTLRTAVDWADEQERRAEAATGRLQLAELIAHSSTREPERRWMRARQAAWSALRDEGIDPTPIAYAGAVAASASTSDLRARLTKRETEILRLLAEGLTYRAAAERLGLSWRTVQNRAYSIYEKLGVSGKVAAIAEGQRIGVIGRGPGRTEGPLGRVGSSS